MKRLLKAVFILALVLCFTIPAFAIKILPYNVPLQDLMRWDKYGAALKLSNPEGETLTVAWATTVDLWNYDGSTWTFDLPSGDTFAFGKGVAITGVSSITGATTITGAVTITGDVGITGVSSFTLSSAATTGTIQSVVISQTMTVLATANYIEVLNVTLTSDVKTGACANAIFAKIDYVTDGLAHGEAGVIAAELSLPASSVARGEYNVWKTEIDVPTNCVMNANPIHIFGINVWGGAATQFDDYGYLFNISGVTTGADDFFYLSDVTLTKCDGFLKIKVLGVTYYIPITTVQTGGD